jgi:hypothetical protein
MAVLFPRWSTHALRAVLLVLLLGVIGVPCLAMVLVRSPYVTNQYEPLEQPVAFDHRHHVLDDGIDCRYCHGAAERSAYAGVPATAVCMGCHAQIWSRSPALAVVYDSWRSQTPIRWVRVTALPDFVYFNHQAHVRRGVGCSDCHGQVEHMARVEKAQPMTMDWCLDCHRQPQAHVRPLDHITDIHWQPTPAEQAVLGPHLVRSLHIAPPVNCSGCHR